MGLLWTEKDGTKVYGPYKGSSKRSQNEKRPIVKKRKPNGDEETTTLARAKKERGGKELSRSQHVAHKPGTTVKDSSKSSTRVESGSKNVADGNRSRRKK